MLSLPNTASKIYTVTMFTIVNIYKMLHTEFVDTFKIIITQIFIRLVPVVH